MSTSLQLMSRLRVYVLCKASANEMRKGLLPWWKSLQPSAWAARRCICRRRDAARAATRRTAATTMLAAGTALAAGSAAAVSRLGSRGRIFATLAFRTVG